MINATIRSLKYNGGMSKDELDVKNMDYLKKGICNLKVHIENMKKYLDNVVICLNKFISDDDEEINFVQKYCENLECEFAVSNSHQDGGEGALDLAEKIVNLCDNEKEFHLLYDENESIKEKISKVSKEIYHAAEVKYLEEAIESINKIEEMHLDKLPICVAKTQYSISDDPKKLGYPEEYEITVRDVKVNSGAGFIVVYMGKIMTMPGLSKNPAYENMHIEDDGTIYGLF